jgi:hypothetical protein
MVGGVNFSKETDLAKCDRRDEVNNQSGVVHFDPSVEFCGILDIGQTKKIRVAHLFGPL